MGEIIASTYEVIQKLGSGGGGVVYLVRHLRLNKKIVLKADKRKLSTPPELLRREVDVLKDLNHPHIPRVYDFFIENDTVYTAMDYIEGESLDRALKRGEKFDQATVIGWAVQLLDALAYLNSPTHGDPPRGFIHSDIKPANIMLLPDGSICLIDFNISLALGEKNLIGCSEGYASPEHYGLDYSGSVEFSSTAAEPTERVPTNQETIYVPSNEITAPARLPTQPKQTTAGAVRLKTITPDVRSDIYSMGATLYHLLCGMRPARNAKEVVPLSGEAFSPQVVTIIQKAMRPDPDLRYQSAGEMLHDFTTLRQRDSRVRALKRSKAFSTLLFAACFSLGIFTAFVGLKRMETTQSWLKLAEYAQNALQSGDPAGAVDFARQAFPPRAGILVPPYVPQAQAALTAALGVYDLADTYQSNGVVELPAAPLYVTLSPDGKTAACLYSGQCAIIDAVSCKILQTLPAADSALAEAAYLDDTRLAYAGADGLSVYDITQGKVLWQGQAATALSVSGDEQTIAAIYRDEARAVLYAADTGRVLSVVDFAGKKQRVATNDIFANPHDNLLALNQDGTLLAVSFEDGALQLFDLTATGPGREILSGSAGYTHFEGGFSGQYFAFSASMAGDSVFAVLDVESGEQTGGFQSDQPFSVQADASGICVQTENVLVQIDPETGEQTSLADTAENIVAFSKSDTHTLLATAGAFCFYDRRAGLTASYEKTDGIDFVRIAGETALIANRDVPSLRFMRYENHPEAELLSYDPAYTHDEARQSADGQTFMLFSYDRFRIYDKDGKELRNVDIPKSDLVYDQQYRRAGKDSYLEVTYYDGTVAQYDGTTGTLRGQAAGPPPDATLEEEFLTDTLRVESPLHGTPAVYDLQTGKQVAQLESEAYLTYITQVPGGLVAQYVTAEGVVYGELLNEQCEVLAKLPYLCDVREDALIFDYPTGNIRQTHMYQTEELLQLAADADG